MPASGKSTAGVLLAKQTARNFMDSDLLIQAATGRSLQDIVDHDGYMALRGIEEQALLALDCSNHVIATGGSAAYSAPAMTHLRKNGVAVFLDVDLETLQERLWNFDTRGLAKRPDQTLSDLYAERIALYRQHADITIPCARLDQDGVCAAIVESLSRRNVLA